MTDDLDNIINLHGWKINQQSFLEIKGSNYGLSVIPEYCYYSRDQNGRVFRSNVPQGIVLNSCIYDRNTGKSQMYITISSEEEFVDFMIGIQKQIKLEQVWQD